MKLKTIIKYECWTTLKPLCIFYAICYSVVALGYFIAFIIHGNIKETVFQGSELACLIYLGILGSLGFHEDFKFLIQNGFTRQHISFAAFGMFSFVTALMAFIDTIIAYGLSQMTSHYSLFHLIYGFDHPLIIQIVWLWLIYMFVTFCSYLCTLISNKVGKKIFYFAISTLAIVCMVIAPLFISLILPASFVNQLMNLGLMLLGFTTKGTVQFMNPILTYLGLICVIGLGAYWIVQKTELRL